MQASTWFDPVLGLDLHIVMVPTPAGALVPTPMMFPFIGLVWDPLGALGSALFGELLQGSPGLVFVNGVFATNAGTGVTSAYTCPHFTPPPTVFATLTTDDDAELLFGAQHVTMAGSEPVRMGELALSCADPVRLGTSFVITIPKGPSVIVNGPTGLSAAAVLSMVLGAAARRALRALGRFGLSLLRTSRRFAECEELFTRALARRRVGIEGMVDQGPQAAMEGLVRREGGELASTAARRAEAIPDAVCDVVGHPVDVATGRMFTHVVDCTLPGPIPLTLMRRYSTSSAGREGPLGRGWSHSLDQSVFVERGRLVVLWEDGREIELSTMHLPAHEARVGDTLTEPRSGLTLRVLGEGRYRVSEPFGGLVRDYEAVPGRRDGRSMLRRVRTFAGHHTIDFDYDSRGQLTQVRDSAGRVLCIEHRDGRWHRVKLPLPEGHGWFVHRTFAYDADGDLVRADDAHGHSWRYEYVEHLMVRETDRNGLSFYFEYDGRDALSRCTRTWGDGGIYDREIAYAPRRTVVQDASGAATVYELGTDGRVSAVTGPDGSRTERRYDTRSGQLVEVTRSAPGETSRTTRATYDALGRCVALEMPGGATTHAEHDAFGMTRLRDARGAEWSWAHDPVSGELREARDARGLVTRYIRARGLITSVEQHWPLGARHVALTIERDERLDVSRLLDAAGASTSYRHDRLGRLVEQVDPNGARWERRWDLEGRLVAVVEPTGTSRAFAYDREGHILEAHGPRGVERTGYTGLYALAWREAPDGSRVTFERDLDDRLVAIVDEAGQRHVLERGPTGAISREIEPDGTVREYLTNGFGELRAIISPGSITEIRRDSRGHAIELRVLDTSTHRASVVEHERDALGDLIALRITELGTPDAWASDEPCLVPITGRPVLRERRTRLVRDVTGTLTREQHGDGSWVEHERDARGLVHTQRTSWGHVEHIRHDARGLATRITLEGSPARRIAPSLVELEHDALGLLTGTGTVGLHERTDRDALGRVVRTRAIDRAGARIAERTYHWSAEHDALELRRDARWGDTRYFRDGRGRVLGALVPDGSEQLRALDTASNVYRSRDGKERAYGPAGRLDRVGDVEHVHDVRGRLVERRYADGTRDCLEWSPLGHLERFERRDGLAVEMEYDALSRRTRKHVRSTSGETVLDRRFVWSGSRLVHEHDDGAEGTTWTWEPGTFRPLAKEENGRRWAVLCDPLGAPTELVDEAGAIAWSAQLDLFGVATTNVGETDCPWRFPGQYADAETGLHYNLHRYYDPESGRYITKDPIGLLGGLRPYGYVDDPTTWCDPLGLSGCRIQVIGDSNLFMDRVENPSLRAIADDLLADPSLHIVIPSSAVGEISGSPTELARIWRAAGVIEQVDDPDLTPFIAAHTPNPGAPTLVGKAFGRADTVLAALSDSRRVPILTTNAAMYDQLGSRRGALPRARVIRIGVDVTSPADLPAAIARAMKGMK